MKRRIFVNTMMAGVASQVSCVKETDNKATDNKPKGLKLSITCDMFLGEDIGLPIDTVDGLDPRPLPRIKYSPDEALALAKEQGYQAFELFNWHDPEELQGYTAAMKKYGLHCACISAGRGIRAPECSLTDPSEQDGFLQEITASIQVAQELGTKSLVALTGLERAGVPRTQQLDSCVAGLRAAAPLLEKSGQQIILEPINTLVTRPGFFLASAREGFEILQRVDSPNVKLLFDIYHVQISDGDLIGQIRNNIDLIGHFHIGDHPGRMQPGTGEINYRNVLHAIYDFQESGQFDGYSALEYHPNVPLPQTMAEMRQLANFS